MALYNWALIEDNLIGDSTVQIKEDSLESGMSNLLNSIGSKKYIVKGVRIWASSSFQLDNPVAFSRINVNGRRITEYSVPDRDVYQFIVQHSFEEQTIYLSEETEMEYVINANTTVMLTLQTDDSKQIENVLSNLRMIQQWAGIGAVIRSAQNTFDTTTPKLAEWNLKSIEEPGEKIKVAGQHINFTGKKPEKSANKVSTGNKPKFQKVVVLGLTLSVIAFFAGGHIKMKQIFKT